MTDSLSAPPSLDELLAAVQRGGNVGAWRALLARLTPRLYRVARGLTAWRVLGAQTVVEHAWRAALRSPGALDDVSALRRLLLTEVVGRALALGDSPRDILDDDHSARLAAMRAVALLPHPSRAVLVLADIGGVSLTEVADLLALPDARLKAELWHARLAVDTLRGAGTGTAPGPPPLAAVDAAPAADVDDDDAGVAPLWLEPVPDELLDRLADDLHDRRQRRRLAPRAAGKGLPVFGGLLAIVALAASAMLWHDAPRLARNLPAAPSAPANPASSVGGMFGDSAHVGRLRSDPDAVPDGAASRRDERIADRHTRPAQPHAAG